MILPLESNRVRRTYLGGGRIDAFTGSRPAADGVPRPEDWLASTTTAYNGTHEIEGEGLGRIADGRLVRDVAGTLPILVKLLDSDERLVIQAHPTVPFAQARLNSPVGKTECGYVLPGTAADACVYLGFRPGITLETWRRAFELQEGLLELLHRVPVKAGDFVFVDGGVPHAIGAGCFMVELQEPSDLMVVAERSTPSGRRIPDGKIFGGLDLDGMLDVYGYEGVSYDELCEKYVRRSTAYPASEPAVRILDPGMTDKFEMWRMTEGGNVPLGDKQAVAVVAEGEGMLNGCLMRKGDRLLVYDERELSAKGKAIVLICK